MSSSEQVSLLKQNLVTGRCCARDFVIIVNDEQNDTKKVLSNLCGTILQHSNGHYTLADMNCIHLSTFMIIDIFPETYEAIFLYRNEQDIESVKTKCKASWLFLTYTFNINSYTGDMLDVP